MSARHVARRVAASLAASAAVGTLALAFASPAGAATGPTSGSVIPNAAQPTGTVTPGPFDSGQNINVVVPTNQAFGLDAGVNIVECSAPNGVVPTLPIKPVTATPFRTGPRLPPTAPSPSTGTRCTPYPTRCLCKREAAVRSVATPRQQSASSTSERTRTTSPRPTCGRSRSSSTQTRRTPARSIPVTAPPKSRWPSSSRLRPWACWVERSPSVAVTGQRGRNTTPSTST